MLPTSNDGNWWIFCFQSLMRRDVSFTMNFTQYTSWSHFSMRTASFSWKGYSKSIIKLMPWRKSANNTSQYRIIYKKKSSITRSDAFYCSIQKKKKILSWTLFRTKKLCKCKKHWEYHVFLCIVIWHLEMLKVCYRAVQNLLNQFKYYAIRIMSQLLFDYTAKHFDELYFKILMLQKKRA